jgi:hypothetical protein
VTRFVSAVGRATSPRLGLRSFRAFTPASSSATVLRRVEAGPVAGRRSGWPGAVASGAARAGAPRPSIAIHWAHPSRARADRRSSAAAAPWRG